MINWSRAIVAGLIAGLVFVMMEMILVTLAMGGSAWGPPRMMAAIVMGRDVLPPPATFSMGIVMVGMLLHFVLAIAYAVILAFVIRSMSVAAAIGTGALFGLALYVVNFYGLTAVFDWFAMARNWVTLISHVAFGAVAAWYYVAGTPRRT
ncbi:MAG: hypothetical protein H0W33_11185 [Gammaproteobacteria bacterium]|nr:hypothetical protein [Gammaproteobacteria bacterium]